MSIYASLPAPDTEHTDDCNVWDKSDGVWAISKRPCTCGTPGAPLIYYGSHVLPEADHPRGGSIDIALIPGHVRFERENPDADILSVPSEKPEPFLRLGVFGITVQGARDNTVILDRAGVQQVYDTLAHWLTATEGGAA